MNNGRISSRQAFKVNHTGTSDRVGIYDLSSAELPWNNIEDLLRFDVVSDPRLRAERGKGLRLPAIDCASNTNGPIPYHPVIKLKQSRVSEASLPFEAS